MVHVRKTEAGCGAMVQMPAYMTLEASLIVPVAFFVCILLVY